MGNEWKREEGGEGKSDKIKVTGRDRRTWKLR
jgi:hypothetical protein